MMWLDYFLQVFVGALAWCLAIALVVGLVGAIFWFGIKAGERAKIRAARAFLARMRAGR